MSKLIFGTYTINTSEGIYQADFNDKTGEITNVKLMAKLASPTYLAEADNGTIYSVDRVDDNAGGIAAFNGKKDPFQTIQIQVNPGSSPAYVAIDKDRKLVLLGNYHRGTVEIDKINPDNTVTTTDIYQAVGKGPRPEQEKAHIHFANLTPDNRLVAVDLGSDCVLTFDITKDNKLKLINRFDLEPGYGPRHIRFSNNGKHAYLIGELSSKIAVLDYDPQNGSFKLINTVSTIPNDWNKHNGAAAIYLSKDDHFLYASNRGYNTIAVYKVSDNGEKLELIQQISTEGDFPRDFAISPNEKFVIAANQNTDNVTVFKRDPENGKLTLLYKDIKVPEGTYVHFKKQD